MDEGLIPVIEKKLSKILNNMQSPKANTAKELHELILWLRQDRSLEQLRLFWAFMKYLYECFGKESENVKNFQERLFVNIGLVKVIYQSKEKVMLRPESVAFGNCTQKRFNEIFIEVKKFAYEKLGIDFDDFEAYYRQNEELV
jgi:hypothetical protein